MRPFCAGDRVEWRSHFSEKVFRGVVEGFFGNDAGMALCSDQTGLPSRPVSVNRLQRVGTFQSKQGRAA